METIFSSLSQSRFAVSKYLIPQSARLEVEWRESGGPTVIAPERRGFGSRLLEQGLAAELDGKVKLEFRPGGVRCRMELPMQALEPS